MKTDTKTSIKKVDMKKMAPPEQAKLADMLGEEVGKILNLALKKCNTMLKKYGYGVSITMNFHDLNDVNKDNDSQQ